MLVDKFLIGQELFSSKSTNENMLVSFEAYVILSACRNIFYSSPYAYVTCMTPLNLIRFVGGMPNHTLKSNIQGEIC